MQRKITPAERFHQQPLGAMAGSQESFSGYRRLAAQAMLQTAMEIEATDFIGRSSYQRRQDDQGIFRTKPQIALDQIARCLGNGIRVAAWTFDELYGRDGPFLSGLDLGDGAVSAASVSPDPVSTEIEVDRLPPRTQSPDPGGPSKENARLPDQPRHPHRKFAIVYAG
jgi:hypothetical protein